MKNLPVLQEQDPAAVAGRKSIVSHHQDRRLHPAVQIRKRLQKDLCRSGIQRSRRLIRQQQPRPVDHGSGAGTALFLPARNLIGELIPDILNLQKFQDLSARCHNLLLRFLLQSQRQHDIFLDGQRIQQIVLLKHKSQIIPAKV